MKFLLVLLGLLTFLPLIQSQAQEKPGGLIFLRDYGTDDIAYLVVPDKEPIAAVVMLPDKEGMTPQVKSFCEKLGKEGYLILCIDLYNGRTAKTETEEKELAASLLENNVAKTLRTGLKFFESSPRFKMEKIVLLASGVTDTFALNSVSLEKDFLGLALLHPTHHPEEETVLKLKLPLQIQLSEDNPYAASFRSLTPDPGNKSRPNFELHVLPKKSPEAAMIENLHAFFQKIVTQPKAQTLIDKIF